MKFTTQDVDNDLWSYNCAQSHQGAWWFNNCGHSHLNGRHHNQGVKGIIWYDFKRNDYSLKVAEMKVGRDQN